jgi:probable HAF family extracellular repeat protein
MRTLNGACKAILARRAFAVLGFVASRPATAASFYSIADLGPGIAENINDSGQVVGGSVIFQQELLRAFIWSQSTGFTALGPFGGHSSIAQSINNSGQVVSSASNTSGEALAFLWCESTGLTDLGTLPGTIPFGTQENIANAINDLAQVADFSNTEAFFWSESTDFIMTRYLTTIIRLISA